MSPVSLDDIPERVCGEVVEFCDTERSRAVVNGAQSVDEMRVICG
jgi:hypothetical protein